ncbi:hypothetical protein ABIF38_006339 [Bradyrhizobium japonicum]|jgi:hypothetical protein|uniref:Uncharacterized protein n=1 Tax=Bradyrhizobium elkanii TaxID=29448 RepID=A0ABV4F2M3_BRAEL|nr:MULTISPECIES: hypothetical protein [Bradyrhizobium]MBP2426478.1 hypothetical protein [Bradyrhizobium elkanii]MCP1731353.1 hypothetical protein [Bradyrhizobium elkanii]MCP1758301.1 hypothetical protein [Bradyrhizobium elkanii]MCP1931874.1 hypothetical protein [Bradyrhizobium elkanii]MCP1983617.1 hypothetical protein [Bradyrhizobium elkanii]
MQNASVAALAYEFLFEVYRKMDLDRKRGNIRSLPDENGTLREAFHHEFSSNWEWPGGVLEQLGVLRILQPTRGLWGPNFYPVMTLDECSVANFSKFETFDNYCVAMSSFEVLHSPSEFRGEVYLHSRSPHFLDAVASQDDIFLIQDDGQVRFDQRRFNEKVMTRWEELEVRRIHPKGGT